MVICLLLFLPPSAFPLPPSYDSFPLLHSRNVFDPDRHPPPAPGAIPAASADAARPDYAALTGTLVNTEKTYAFFSGSRPEFNKVLTVRDKIADGTITGITPLNIEIERGGKRTLVAVGQTVPLDAQATPGPAPASAAAPTVTRIPSPPAPGNPQPASAASAPSAAKLEEIRQRMMQKRQQDLK